VDLNQKNKTHPFCLQKGFLGAFYIVSPPNGSLAHQKLLRILKELFTKSSFSGFKGSALGFEGNFLKKASPQAPFKNF
jgi:hypothetical protein